MKQQSLWQFLGEQHEKLFTQLLQHLGLTFLSLVFAVVIGLPLGILIVRKRVLANIVLGIAGVLQTVPSIALLGFMIPAFGIGITPAIVALLIYALLPIVRNTYTGVSQVDPQVFEAAKALGMNRKQILFKVELPLAMPVILAGIRTATVINVGVATLASFVAAGGLGEFIFGGISLNNTNMILAGAIPAALLAVFLDQLIAVLQKGGLKIFRKALWGFPILLLVTAVFLFIKAPSGNQLKSGFTPEFMGRRDGDLGLRTVYGINLKPLVISDAIMYKAVHDGELDLISGYSTDGRIKAFDLVTLEDDKKIFPPYYAAPIIKTVTLNKFPGLDNTLNLLNGKLNDSLMTDLNFKSDFLKQTPEKVAKDYLLKIGMYRKPGKRTAGTVRIGSKIFGEQYILTEIYRMLIEGYTDYSVETKTGLGGTKICFEALRNDGIDFYVEYTGTGLLVLLNPSEKDLTAAVKSPEETLSFVRVEFKKRFGIDWLQPIGFNNTYALMMRKKQANALHIKRISDLKRYLDNQ